MAFQGALGLGAARLHCPQRFTTSSNLNSHFSQHIASHGRVSVRRNVAPLRKNGVASNPFVARGRWGIDGRFLARERLVVEASAGSDAEPSSQFAKHDSPVDPETGIDAEGYVTASVPEEWKELMKDEGDPPDYWFMAFAVVVVILARRVILNELLNWLKLAILLVVFAVESVQALFYKSLELGGQPMMILVEIVSFFAQNITTFFSFTAEMISIPALAFAVLLSTIVLLVGESVSVTYKDAPEFPSRNMLDFAGGLGLLAAVSGFSAGFMVLGLVGITAYLLLVKKYNPVAGFTPAVATLVAIGSPAIRWSLFAAFVGSSMYRYWKKGYLSQGAVLDTRRGEYPRVLVGLVYLIGISMVAKVVFFLAALLPESSEDPESPESPESSPSAEDE